MSASFRPIYLGESGKGKSVAKNRLGLAKEIGESPIAILTNIAAEIIPDLCKVYDIHSLLEEGGKYYMDWCPERNMKGAGGLSGGALYLFSVSLLECYNSSLKKPDFIKKKHYKPKVERLLQYETNLAVRPRKKRLMDLAEKHGRGLLVKLYEYMMATVMFRNFHGVVAKALAPFVVQKGHPVQYGGKWNNRSLALKLLPRRNPVFTSWHTELDQDGRAAQMQSAESAAASKEASDVRTSVDSSGAARGKAPQKRTSCDQENYFIVEHNLDRTVFRNVPEGTTRAYLKERMVLQMSCFEGATPRSCDAVARKIVNALWPYIETDSPVVGQIFAMLLACHVPNQFYFPQLFASAIPGLVVRDITREDGTTQPEWIWIEDQAWYESWYDEIFTVGEKPIIYKAVPVKKILPSDDGMTDTVEKMDAFYQSAFNLEFDLHYLARKRISKCSPKRRARIVHKFRTKALLRDKRVLRVARAVQSALLGGADRAIKTNLRYKRNKPAIELPRRDTSSMVLSERRKYMRAREYSKDMCMAQSSARVIEHVKQHLIVEGEAVKPGSPQAMFVRSVAISMTGYIDRKIYQ